MTHLGERVTEFVFGELSPAEMDETRRHVEACTECRTQVEQFERTRSLMRTSPDVEPPRRIVFEVERRPAASMWRWLAPVGVAAAILIAVLVAAPPHIQWNNSQLTIVFGAAPIGTPQPITVLQAATVGPVDYDRIFKKLETELDKRDAVRVKQIQRLQDQWVFVEAQKREFERSAIQVIAESGTQE